MLNDNIRNLSHVDQIIHHKIDRHLVLVEIICFDGFNTFLYSSYFIEMSTRLAGFLMTL